MLDIQQVFDGTFTGSPPAPAGAAITVTRASTNVLDMLVARDVGAGNDLGLHCIVMANFATLTSLTVECQVSADNITFYTLLTSPAYPVAQLVVGAPLFRYVMPVNQLLNSAAGVLKAPGRYIRLYHTVGGADATAGSVFAYLNAADDRNVQNFYPSNYTAP